MGKNTSKLNTKLLLAIVVLVIVIAGLVAFVFLKPPEIATKEEAEKSSQGVLKDIGDIKSTLQEIRDNLKKG